WCQDAEDQSDERVQRPGLPAREKRHAAELPGIPQRQLAGGEAPADVDEAREEIRVEVARERRPRLQREVWRNGEREGRAEEAEQDQRTGGRSHGASGVTHACRPVRRSSLSGNSAGWNRPVRGRHARSWSCRRST